MRELIKAIRQAEAEFVNNEESIELTDWARGQRRIELSQVLLMLRSDLVYLVEDSLVEPDLKAS